MDLPEISWQTESLSMRYQEVSGLRSKLLACVGLMHILEIESEFHASSKKEIPRFQDLFP